MTKLYLDCDGVILDTINMSYKMIKNKGLTNEKDIEHFYKNLSWEELIIEAGEINNSIEKIKELTKVYDVEILTHVNSDGEIIAKLNYFKEVLPEVKVIAVPKEIKKADAVDPKGNILVDDFLGNLVLIYLKLVINYLFSSIY
jgi:5S rRNA maturation endonuclease (ribonuclease M5)